MIPTNQIHITFDHEAIAHRFLILEIKRDSGHFERSPIPDLALEAGHAPAAAYEYSPRCYLLYDRQNLDWPHLKVLLEREANDLCLQEITSAELAQNNRTLLAQLLCNAIPALSTDGSMYHNLAGKLYYRDISWYRGRCEAPSCFWALRIQLTWDSCLKLSVVTFRTADHRQDDQNTAQYLFDQQSGFLRRLGRKDPDSNSRRFVIGSLDRSRKNTVSFLEFGSLEDFQRCKVGILYRFLTDVEVLLVPCLTLCPLSLPEDVCRGLKPIAPQLDAIRSRLREIPLFLEYTVQNEASAALTSLLRQELERYSGLFLQEGRPEAESALFRIVHNKEFYENCPDQDPYKRAPSRCAVQHLTVEDFPLNGRNRTGTKAKADASLRKVLQETAVKLDIKQGRVTCYDWAARAYAAPVNFVVVPEETKGQGKRLHYRRLRILPNSTLQFSQWPEQLLWDDTEKEKIAAAFHKTNGRLASNVEGLIYEDIHDLQIIHHTERYTLPDLYKLNNLLASTRNKELLDVPSLLAVAQELLTTAADKG